MTEATSASARNEQDRLRAARRGKILKVVRRIHLIAGVLLFPWVALYGLSGFFFNHPMLGVPTDGRPLTPDELGVPPADARQLAQDVVTQLNADASLEGGPFRVADDFTPKFSGGYLLLAKGDRSAYQFLYDVNAGRAVVLTRPKVEPPPGAPFVGKSVSLPEHEVAAIEQRYAKLLPRLGLEDVTLKPRGQVGPELRFHVVDANGRAFEAGYHLGKKALDGKPVDSPSGLTFSQSIQRLHMTHHYPNELGPVFFWALFQDLTGLTLIVWALTGLVMAFTIKAVRTVVIGSVVAAVLISAWVFRGTFAEITYGHVSAINGPGDR